MHNSNIVRNTNASGLCRPYFVETICPMSIHSSNIVKIYIHASRLITHFVCLSSFVLHATEKYCRSTNPSLSSRSFLSNVVRNDGRKGNGNVYTACLSPVQLLLIVYESNISYHLCSFDARAQCSNLACVK